MNPFTKKIIAVAGSGVLLWVAYYGSYLPLAKAQAFIDMLYVKDPGKTIPEIEKNFSAVLDISSPIGHEELVRTMTNSILGLFSKLKDPKDVKEVARYVEQYYQPIIEQGRGMSFSQNLYILAAVHQAAFSATKDMVYFENAKRYLSLGLERGPRRPQFLYGVLWVAVLEQNATAVQSLGAQILSYWPNSPDVARILGEVAAKGLTDKK